jgi:hypothetical protein
MQPLKTNKQVQGAHKLVNIQAGTIACTLVAQAGMIACTIPNPQA